MITIFLKQKLAAQLEIKFFEVLVDMLEVINKVLSIPFLHIDLRDMELKVTTKEIYRK